MQKQTFTSLGLVLGLAAVLTAAVLAVVTLSAHPGAGSNGAAAIAQARRETAFHVHRAERLRGIEGQLRRIRGGHADVHVHVDGAAVAPSQGSGNVEAAPAPAPDPTPDYGYAGSCGDGTSVNSVTSCPFARNVESAYYEHVGSGSGSVEAWSPVTHRSYLMACSGAPHECTGGDNAVVYFP